MVWAYIGIIIVSLFISAFVAGSETALVSINRYKVRDMVRRNDRRAKLIANVLKNPEDFFSAILLINNLVNILISTLAGRTNDEPDRLMNPLAILISTARSDDSYSYSERNNSQDNSCYHTRTLGILNDIHRCWSGDCGSPYHYFGHPCVTQISEFNRYSQQGCHIPYNLRRIAPPDRYRRGGGNRGG